MRALLSTIKIQFKQTFGRTTFRYCILIQPIIFAIILYMMYMDNGNENFYHETILQSGFMSLWSSSCCSSLLDIHREKNTKTIGYLISCPTSLYTIMLGKIIANNLLGLISFFVSFGTISVLTGKIECSFLGIDFYVNFLLLLISFILVSLILASCFALVKNALPFINCMEYPIYILCGIAAPIELLPKSVQTIGMGIPITWIVSNIRSIYYGKLNNIHYYQYFILIVVFSFVSIILMNEIEKRIKESVT